LKAASKIPGVTVHIHPGGHFDPYVEPMFPTVIEEQLAFLRTAVPLAS